MAKVTAAQCPNCGAMLELSQGASVATCSYCQTTVQIQRGGPKPPAMPPPPRFMPGMAPPPPAKMPQVVYVPKQSGGAGAILAMTGLLVVVGAAAAIFMTGVKTTSRLGAEEFGAPEILGAVTGDKALDFQFSSKALIEDLDGDGKNEIIGEMVSHQNGEEHWIGAFDTAKKSELLWKTEALDKSIFSHEGVFGIDRGLIIGVDNLGEITALDAKKEGKGVWKATLTERADELCATPSWIGITTKDEAFQAFDRKSGKKVAAANKSDCKRMQTNARAEELESRIIGWGDFDKYGLRSHPYHNGYRATEALVPDDSDVRYLLGSEEKGSDVPMVIAMKSNQVQWATKVAKSQPLNAEPFRGTVVAGYTKGRLAVVYETKKDEHKVVLLDTETGKHKWESPVPEHSADVPQGMAIDTRYVYYSTWTSLFVYSRKSGELRFSIGKF